GGPAHVFGTHDLVGGARLEHAVLVNAGGMGEGVGPDHGLVGLYQEAGGLRHEARGRHDLRGVQPHIQAEVVTTGLDGHHDLFHRTVARALAQTVDGAFDLTRTANHDAGQGVGHRHAQVVVTVDRPDRLVRVGHHLAQGLDEVAVQLGDGI